MKKLSLILFFNIIYLTKFYSQNISVYDKIEKLVTEIKENPFNGTILITENDKLVYLKTQGFSDFESKKSLLSQDSFVIGSISKQFTAALVLIEYDRGRLDLFTPIKKYLPEIKQG